MEDVLMQQQTVTRQIVADEFRRMEYAKLRSSGVTRSEYTYPDMDIFPPGPIRDAAMTIADQNKALNTLLKRPAESVKTVSTMGFDELLMRINANTYSKRVGILCKTFEQYIQVITTITSDGRLVSFANDANSDDPKVVEHPTWIESFDVYKGQKPMRYGQGSSFNEDRYRNSKRGWEGPYRKHPRGGGRQSYNNGSDNGDHNPRFQDNTNIRRNNE